MSSATEESDNEVPEQNKTQSEEGSTTDEENPVQTDDEEGAVGGTKAPAESYHSEKEEDSIYETDDNGEARSSHIYPTPPSDGENMVPASKPKRGKRRRTVIEMAMDAIEELKNKRGSSVIAIVKYLRSNDHKVANERRFNTLVYRMLKQGVTDGQVTQHKRSFKLSQATINERKAEEKMKGKMAKEQEQKSKGKKEDKSNKRAKAAEEEVSEVSSEDEDPKPRDAAKRRAKPPATGRGKPAKASERKTNQPRKKMKKSDGSAYAVAVTSTSNKAAAGAAVLAAMEMAGPSRTRNKRMITEVMYDDDEDNDEDEKDEDDDDEEDEEEENEDDEDNKAEDPLETPQTKKGKGAALIKIKLPDSFSTSKLVAQATSTPQAADKKATHKRK
ncbi:nucleolin-like [Drosophila guanche]|uniref:nucleolin-like n=1 Tax=Drosophila guanche TaxID=7266 RepID=UPI001470D9E8|nr:nucleolin-like [Drosophila guanche]